MIKINIHTQPDDETCGPTSLHAIYNFYNDNISLESTINQVERSHTGGTLAPMLASHALARGYRAHIYSYNLDIFDPSWFHPRKLSPQRLIKKLDKQLLYKYSRRITESSAAYKKFLSLGGDVYFRDLTIGLLKHYFERNIPILTGLSATYLYQSKREIETSTGMSIYDDLKGGPCGHFVILCGYDETKRHIIVADPHRENPISHNNYYKVSVGRLINSIVLGVLTHDANLLVIVPDKQSEGLS